MMLHICAYGYFYVQNSWANNIADAVFADPPVSHCFMYMQYSVYVIRLAPKIKHVEVLL